jgi:hypothetical protein
MQIATSPAALLERSGPHELAADARPMSAKEPIEQAPSIIVEPLVAVCADALGITCTAAGAASSAIAVTATTTANAAAIMVLMLIFVLIFSVFSIVTIYEKLQK